MYTHYKCSECLRATSRDFESKGIHIEHCNLTKGCDGFLFKFSESNKALPATYYDGLEDWEDANNQPKPIQTATVYQSLASSTKGSLTLAVKASVAVSTPEIVLTLERPSVANSSTTTFVFNLLKPTRMLFGKDSNNLLLRMSQVIVDNRQVIITVNGVAYSGQYTLGASTVEFPTVYPKGTVIRITAFSLPPTTVETVRFYRNVATVERDSAFNNVDTVKVFSLVGDTSVKEIGGISYMLYHTREVQVENIAMFRVVGMTLGNGVVVPVSSGFFCLAEAPYDGFTRDVSEVVRLTALAELSVVPSTSESGLQTLSVDAGSVSKAYPPLIFLGNNVIPVNTKR